MTVTLAMLVKDPPIDRMAALLDLVSPIVGQTVVVVDDRTRDSDVRLIESWGAQAVPWSWNDNFSDARNAALPFAKGDWILHLDPDEVPTLAAMEFIRAVDAGIWTQGTLHEGSFYPEAQGYLFWFRNYWGGERGEEREYHWHCRLFRRALGSWYKPVHEQVALDSRLESQTRGTPLLPKAPKGAYVIHSKPAEALAAADTQYAAIEKA